MAQRSCCVPGCSTKLGGGLLLHRFPNPNNPGQLERFRTWVMKIGGDIVGEDNEFIHKNRKVCHKHFEDIYLFPNKKLTTLAIPTLELPGVHVDESRDIEQPSTPDEMATASSTRPIHMDADLSSSPEMKETTGEIDTRNVVKNRELLYRMIISQLFYDGFQPIAASLASAVHADPPCPPSDRLLNLMMVGLQHEPDRKDRLAASSGAEHLLGTTGFDLEYEMDASSLAPEPATYETAYVTSHKMACRAGAFSACGQLVATGSVDASIKILDVERMLAKSAPEEVDPGREQQGHPVIRTLYDHTDEITALDFHPREQILVSASRDCCIKLFDITKASAKKAYKSITDAEQVLCVAFHPLGDHIIASSTQPVIRLYDVTTSACFVCPIPSHHHTRQVNSIQFSPNGKYFASGSADGSVKLWDTVSNRCFNTFINAHDGSEVCSVAFTRNSKYLLTSGLDSSIKLWELASSRCLIQYTGAGTTGKQEHHAQAIFNHTEDYVMFPDEATTSLCTWHSRSASRCQLMSLGHNGAVRFIVHSGTAPAFLTCSDDYRARFWYRRNTH